MPIKRSRALKAALTAAGVALVVGAARPCALALAEGVLAKLFRVEDRVLARTSVKWAELAAKKPTASEMAGFQKSVAAEAYEALRREFAALR